MSLTLKFKTILVLAVILFLNCSYAYSQALYREFDALRTELYTIQDKNSPLYQKTRKKLDKYITNNRINYSINARFDDINRLIFEQKYQAAMFELFDLIECEIETSKSYELLGDIHVKKQDIRNASRFYKIAKQHDVDNISVAYKHAKLYINQNKNIMATELLKEIAQKSTDFELLSEIEKLVSTKIKPLNGYEANNLYEVLAIIYTKLGDVDKTYFALDRALSLNPTDTFLKYWLGDLFLKNQDNKNAIMVYNSILVDIPHDTQIRNSKAKALMADGNMASARREYLVVLDKYPDSLQAKYGMYKIYQNKLTPEEILIKINPQKKNFKPNHKDFLAFSAFLEDMDDIEGAAVFKKCAEKLAIAEAEKMLAKKQNAEILDKRVVLKKEIVKNESKNVQKQQKEEKNNNKKINYKKEQVKKDETKKEDKQKLQPKMQENKADNKVVKSKTGVEKYQKTLDEYFKITPKTAEIYIAIANTYKLAGENQLALKYFEEAKKLAPTNPDIYYHLGLISFEQNNLVKARDLLQKSINLDKENLKAKNLLAFVDQKIITEKINVAYTKYEKKEYIESLNILDKTIKIYPKNSQLYYYRALVYASMNRNGAAIIDLQKAIELDYGNYMAYYQLGKAYEKIKDEKSALVSYERFLSIEPDEKELISEVEKKVLTLSEKYY